MYVNKNMRLKWKILMKYDTKRDKKRCYLIFNPNEYVMSDTLPYPRRNIAYEHNIFAP